MKIKNIIIIVIAFILITPLNANAASSVIIECEQTTLSPNETTTCTLKGTSDSSITTVDIKLALGENLSLESAEVADIWNGDAEDGYYALAADIMPWPTSEFAIGSFEIKAANINTLFDTNIKITTPLFADDEFEEILMNDVIKTISIVPYTINYVDGENTFTEYYSTNEITLKSDLTKTGYTLVGWESETNCYLLTDLVTMPADEITLNAIWQANKYEVTYDNSKEKFEVTYGEPYGNLVVPTKKGHTFKGWYLENLFENEVKEDTIVTSDFNHSLYDKWEINSYKLTINPNGGEYTEENELMLNYNATTDVSDLTRTGFIFKGWEVAGEESTLNNGLFTMGIGDTTLTAKWEAIIPDIEATSDYVLKENKLTNISLETAIENFSLGLNSIYNTKIINNKNNTEKTSGLIATGDKVQIYLEDTLVVEYTVVVKGDVSGDGKANVADYSKAYQYYKKRITMEEHFIEASDVVKNDSVITMADVSKIYQFIKNRISTLD